MIAIALTICFVLSVLVSAAGLNGAMNSEPHQQSKLNYEI